LQKAGVAVPGDLTIGDGGTVLLAADEQISQVAGKQVTVNSGGVLDLGDHNETLARLHINSSGSVTASSGILLIDEQLQISGGLLSASLGLGDVTASVTGGGQVTSQANLVVGLATTGTMSIESGGRVTSDEGTIADDPGSMGQVTVNGAGSRWISDGDLIVGYAGHGNLLVSNQGYVQSYYGVIAALPQSFGRLVVDGGLYRQLDQSPSVPSVLVIGDSGEGELQIENDGAVEAGSLVIGSGSTSTGLVQVKGPSEFRWKGPMSIGRFGDGTFEVTGGATALYGGLSAAHVTLGVEPGSMGHLRVDGPGTRFNGSVSVIVGRQGDGLLEVTNGGLVQVANLVVGFATTLPGSGAVQIDGSTSRVQTALVSIGNSTAPAMIRLANGGHVISPIVDVGPLGVLEGSGQITGNVDDDPTTVQNNGTVRGSLTINGALVNGGLASPGVLTVDGDYAQSSSGELLIELASATGYGQLLVTGEAALHGKLTVNLVGGYIPNMGETFTILLADDVDGTFFMEAMPTVPHLAFDLVYNPQSVVVKVVPASGGDFDADGDVDGADLLVWQRGRSPDPISAADLAAWKGSFGRPASTMEVVPEPHALGLAWVAALLAWRMRSRRIPRVGFEGNGVILQTSGNSPLLL
jgi:T5SS/PEP-CTERM-associated repeat protein